MPASLGLVRGGGDLASGVVLRLYRAGLQTVVTELPEPLAVRRTVSFSEAIYENSVVIEGITARRASSDQIEALVTRGEVPVLVDPSASLLTEDKLAFAFVVDARMLKERPAALPREVPLHIGLGPGFRAGRDCHAVIETRRSHTLGRVYWEGTPQPDSGQPDGDPRRILRAPRAGELTALARIADHLEAGQAIAEIAGELITAPFPGVLRGLIRPRIHVTQGTKVGDLDPRDDPSACYLVSDKSLAIGGGVLEAIFSKPELRTKLWAE
jgi:xanthine dehydrogenase accessory factor